jgi:hypothetical protein
VENTDLARNMAHHHHQVENTDLARNTAHHRNDPRM